MTHKYYKKLPSLTPLSDGKTWRLNENFKVYYPGLGWLIILAGFETDFASIPWIFRLFFSPATGKYRVAALIHDYLYKMQRYARKKCDDIFLFFMKVDGVVWLKRKIIYSGVRAGGWYAWDKASKLLELNDNNFGDC